MHELDFQNQRWIRVPADKALDTAERDRWPGGTVRDEALIGEPSRIVIHDIVTPRCFWRKSEDGRVNTSPDWYWLSFSGFSKVWDSYNKSLSLVANSVWTMPPMDWIFCIPSQTSEAMVCRFRTIHSVAGLPADRSERGALEIGEWFNHSNRPRGRMKIMNFWLRSDYSLCERSTVSRGGAKPFLTSVAVVPRVTPIDQTISSCCLVLFNTILIVNLEILQSLNTVVKSRLISRHRVTYGSPPCSSWHILSTRDFNNCENYIYSLAVGHGAAYIE